MNPSNTQIGDSNTIPNLQAQGQALLNSGQYSVPNTQTLGTINTSGNMNVPPPPVIQNAVGTLTNFANQSQASYLASQAEADKAQNTGNDLMKQILGYGTDQAQLNTQYDTAGLSKKVRDLQALQSQQTAQYIQGLNNIELAKNTRQEANAQGVMLNRQHGIDALLTGAQLQSAQGNVEYANSLIKNALDLKYEPIKAQLEYQKEIVSQLNTRAANDRATALQFQLKQLDQQAETEKNIEGIKLMVAKNGGNPGVLDGVTDFSEAIKKAAPYMTSPADKLDLAIKGMQLQKLKKEISLIGQPTREEIKAQLAEMKTAKGSVPILEDKVALLDSVLNGKASKAINSTVGTSLFSRTAGKFGGVITRALVPGAQGTLVGGLADTLSGARQDLIGSVNQMISKEFLQAVINLKSSGGTLGQLTEKEGAKLQQAATKIGSWEIRNKQDRVIGYNASEKDFRAEIQRIKDSTERILNEARGNSLSAEEQELLDTIYNSGTDASAYFQ